MRIRFLWLLVVCCVIGLTGFAAPPAAHAATTTTGLVPLPPTRLVDTRDGVGAAKSPVAAGHTLTVTVAGHGNLPARGVAAVALNLTLAGTQSGFATAYGTTTRPVSSSVNYVAGQPVSNQVMVPLTSSGTVSVYVSGTANLIVDVTGFYRSGSAFHAATPTRLLDTRTTVAVTRDSVTTLQITGRAGIPTTGVAAAVVNLTAVTPTSYGWLTAFPAGRSVPTASTVNFRAHQSVAGMTLASLDGNGRLSVFSSTTTHLLVDVVGWISSNGAFTPIAPTRLADSRIGQGVARARVPAGGSVTIKVAGVAGVPSDAGAVELNVAAVTPAAAGYLSAYPNGWARSSASTVNVAPGAATSNSVALRVGGGGRVTIFSSINTDLVINVVGSFAAPTTTMSANWIPFSSQRKAEMAAYSNRRYAINSWQLINPKVIVLHYTETADYATAYNTFANDTPSGGELPGTCAHFIIDQSGVVHELVPLTIMCRHTIGLNYTAIGIEMVQTTGVSSSAADQQILARPAQIDAALALVRQLQSQFGITSSNVVGHATANSSPYFKDLTGLKNDHTDWQAADVATFRNRL